MKAYKFCDCSIREFIFSFALLNFIVLAFFINFHLVKFEEILRTDQSKLLYTSSDKEFPLLQKKVDDVYLFSAPLAGALVLRDFFSFDATLFVNVKAGGMREVSSPFCNSFNKIGGIAVPKSE